MNKKFLAAVGIIAALSMSAVSCGNDGEESEVTLSLPVATTELSGEQATTEASGETAETDEKKPAETGKVTTEDSEKSTETTTTVSDDDKDAPVDEVPDENIDTQQEEPPAETPSEEPEPEQPDPEPEPEPPTDAPVVNNGIKFSVDSLGGSADGVISSLGTPSDIQEAPSCLPNGADLKIYTYDNLRVSCYVLDGAEYLFEVIISGGDYATAENIAVGSARSDVLAAYGNDEFVSFGEKELAFSYDGDTVSSIMLHLNL